MAVPMSNAYYGNNFQQNQFQQPMQQQYQQPVQQQYQQQAQQPAQQIQNGGFVNVPSEDIARNYPVAPGNSVTFKNENAPYVYTKTMGFSQLDRPIFEKFRLIKEDNEVTTEVSMEQTQETKNSELMSAYISTTEEFKEATKKDINNIWNEIESLKRQVKRQNRNRKKDNEED